MRICGTKNRVARNKAPLPLVKRPEEHPFCQDKLDQLDLSISSNKTLVQKHTTRKKLYAVLGATVGLGATVASVALGPGTIGNLAFWGGLLGSGAAMLGVARENASGEIQSANLEQNLQRREDLLKVARGEWRDGEVSFAYMSELHKDLKKMPLDAGAQAVLDHLDTTSPNPGFTVEQVLKQGGKPRHEALLALGKELIGQRWDEPSNIAAAFGATTGVFETLREELPHTVTPTLSKGMDIARNVASSAQRMPGRRDRVQDGWARKRLQEGVFPRLEGVEPGDSSSPIGASFIPEMRVSDADKETARYWSDQVAYLANSLKDVDGRAGIDLALDDDNRVKVKDYPIGDASYSAEMTFHSNGNVKQMSLENNQGLIIESDGRKTSIRSDQEALSLENTFQGIELTRSVSPQDDSVSGEWNQYEDEFCMGIIAEARDRYTELKALDNQGPDSDPRLGYVSVEGYRPEDSQGRKPITGTLSYSNGGDCEMQLREEASLHKSWEYRREGSREQVKRFHRYDSEPHLSPRETIRSDTDLVARDNELGVSEGSRSWKSVSRRKDW